MKAPEPRMGFTDAQILFAVRLVHTMVYVVNAAACFVVLHTGLTGTGGPLIWISLGLVAIETAIFFGNGARCPITPLAIRYGAHEDEFLFDTFLPERLTRHTVRFFSAVVLLGLALLVLRWIGMLD